ncbi:MAG: glycosyltransferase [Treponema sp.]|nr:glycosyltransferase [Treponema sp.]
MTATQPSSKAKFHGGGYYAEVVFFALLKRTKNFIGIYNSKYYINPKILESGIKIYDINQISPKEIIEKENIKTFYTALHKSDYESLTKNIRHIITWHGVRELEMPYDNVNFYYANNLKRKLKSIYTFIMKKQLVKRFTNRIANNKAKLEFLTVSEHSKASIINFFPHLANINIPVFYPPYKADEKETGNLPQILESRKFFLLTSSARWEKNNLRAVWAFDELFSQRKDLDFKVVLTGVTDEKIFAKNLKNRNKFIFLGYIDRTELLSLHMNAYAFIYPSLNEGFGYPPIESMRYGVPVATSGTSSIPEVCQNAAIYFDPYNVSEIKNRIIQLLDKNIYNEYSARAVERYKIVSERQKQDLEKIVDYILGEQS